MQYFCLNIKHNITGSITGHAINITSLDTGLRETPSYCFNVSAPTIFDEENEELRLQLIFWVEGGTNDSMFTSQKQTTSYSLLQINTHHSTSFCEIAFWWFTN